MMLLVSVFSFLPLYCYPKMPDFSSFFKRGEKAVHNSTPPNRVELGSRKSGSASVPFWDRGAAALLVVVVALARLHDNIACCDEVIPN